MFSLKSQSKQNNEVSIRHVYRATGHTYPPQVFSGGNCSAGSVLDEDDDDYVEGSAKSTTHASGTASRVCVCVGVCEFVCVCEDPLALFSHVCMCVHVLVCVWVCGYLRVWYFFFGSSALFLLDGAKFVKWALLDHA